ncbi:MAG: hypothetical protein CO141_03135 [Candidatus Moranbacteria bacterium CG_4_9_14_3_um_filter_42_9]|nr:MAG: hypothetical protein CO141_03135 [Candidatus Moranbacteria bacterium CG_4_9_14_3_um_filter_42_9]
MFFQEKNTRSFVKAITFRATIMVADFVVVFAITRRYDIAFGVMLATNFLSTLIYYGHERVWNGIHWGK